MAVKGQKVISPPAEQLWPVVQVASYTRVPASGCLDVVPTQRWLLDFSTRWPRVGQHTNPPSSSTSELSGTESFICCPQG